MECSKIQRRWMFCIQGDGGIEENDKERANV